MRKLDIKYWHKQIGHQVGSSLNHYQFLMMLFTFLFIIVPYCLNVNLFIEAMKKRMEKDIDEVGKIARNVKARLEAINKEVILFSSFLFKCLNFEALELCI